MTILYLDTYRPGGSAVTARRMFRALGIDPQRLHNLIGDLIEHGWMTKHGDAIDDLIVVCHSTEAQLPEGTA